MKYVYLLRSKVNPKKGYIGITTDLKERLKQHNYKQSPHSSKYAPWEIVTYIAFESNETANRFERYLKTGSGRAFAKRHLWGSGELQ
ncbi:GIY-YIG nuclease family protein [bacterium]|nr:GIY-YIG nuclease family protein [bacterium]